MKRAQCIRLALIAIVVLIAGCSLDDQRAKEESAIQDYLKKHNYTSITPTTSGLYYIEKVKGDGNAPVWGKNVKVKYKLTYTDGTEVENGTMNWILGYYGIIDGLNEGVSYMKVGGKAFLVVPSDTDYGTSGYGDIPGYTPLVFEVELLDAD